MTKEEILFLHDLCDLELENNRILKENNKMLRGLVSVVNYHTANLHRENESDFGRNVLANLISNYMK